MPSMPPEKSPEESPPGQVPDERPPGEEEERERRQRALHQLAQDTSTDPEKGSEQSPSAAPIWPESTVRRSGASTRLSLPRSGWLVAAVVLLTLAIGATLILPLLFTAGRTPTVITIDPTARIACSLDAAWSPNGRSIAVLGYNAGCPNSDHTRPYDSGLVTIYNAETGAPVRSLSLDALILNTHQVTLGQAVTGADGSVFAPFIGYQTVLWSPNGGQLAFPFVVMQHPHVFPAPNVPPETVAPSPLTQAGALLTNLDGTAVHVVTAPYTPPLTGHPSGMEWDLRTGKLVTASLTLPPALSYTWGGNGSLIPAAESSSGTASAATPPEPVGNPIGGKSFTIWQPGLASQGYYVNQMGGNGPPTATFVPGVDLWYSNFAVWSPDGRYLISPVYYGGRMALPGQPVPSSAVLQATGQGRVLVFLPHDSALQKYYLATKEAPVAWRPDGQVLAILSYKSTSGKASTAVVTLWDTKSAKVLATYTVKTAASTGPIFGLDGLVGSSSLVAYLRWSPDGSHLLLLDSLVNSRITIWPSSY